MANKDMMRGDSWMFTTLSDTVGDGVTLTDMAGRFASYNDKMKEITGYISAEAPTLNGYLELLYQHAAGDDRTMTEVREIFHRECQDRETMIRAKDGTRKSVSISTSPVEYQGGRFLLHAYRDITSRKRAEEKLLFAEKRYRMLCEQLFDALVIIDPETFLPIDFNDRAPDLFGYSQEEFIGIRIDTLETGGNFIKNKCRDEQTLDEEWTDFETEIYSKKTGIKEVLVSVRVVEISERRLLQCIFHEITGNKRVVVKKDTGTNESHSASHRLKTLTGILPICYVCKKICDDKGSWQQIEAFVGERSDVLFSHELCPSCEHRFYPKPLSGRKQEK